MNTDEDFNFSSSSVHKKIYNLRKKEYSIANLTNGIVNSNCDATFTFSFNSMNVRWYILTEPSQMFMTVH